LQLIRAYALRCQELSGAEPFGLFQQISLQIEPNEFNKKYLDTKAQRLGHLGNTSQGGK
jgi:GTP cyclohydrolase II